MSENDTPNSSSLSVTASSLGGSLMKILEAPDIEPGADLSYELCKLIYLYHPLGRKMAESPIAMAQSQEREIAVQDAPEEVAKAFLEEWGKLGATAHIRNLKTLARVYGLASVVIGCEQVQANQPLEMDRIWEQDIWFNVLDPLNTAGSLVLSQIPTSPHFNKPVSVVTSGQTFHRSRYQVAMNEQPVYLAYTASAFGFVGRSVYQRALFPLKSFIRTMISDDMIAEKLGLLIVKMEQPGSILDGVMSRLAGVKRALLKRGKTGQVLSIGKEESVETLNMQNADGAGKFARDNALKNAATAADMPASFLNNETMVSGFGEGTEDAKNIARWLGEVRIEMQPHYAWFDNIVQYRAWNVEFFKRMQREHPQQYANREYRDVFSEWRRHFTAVWPSLLVEPESELIKVEDVKLQAIVAVLQTLIGQVDADNKINLLEWAADNIAENTRMFPHRLELDWEGLRSFFDEQQQAAQSLAPGSGELGGTEDVGPEARKMGRFDSVDAAMGQLRAAVARLPQRGARARA